jgi:hypothetical protein
MADLFLPAPQAPRANAMRERIVRAEPYYIYPSAFG